MSSIAQATIPRKIPARPAPPEREPVAAARTTIASIVVYIGMVLGGLPYLQLDRTGVALLGAIALVAIGALTPGQAAASVHPPTLLLFSFMVISAQMRLGGFYSRVTRHIAALPLDPPALLAAMIAAVATLSAVFSNDVVCLAVAPVLSDACRRRRLDPVPFLLALACAASSGSAATLIGNPQNMLIGEVLKLPFGGYFLETVIPVVLGLTALWALLAWQSRGRWQAPSAAVAAVEHDAANDAPFDRWQTTKGLTVAAPSAHRAAGDRGDAAHHRRLVRLARGGDVELTASSRRHPLPRSVSRTNGGWVHPTFVDTMAAVIGTAHPAASTPIRRPAFRPHSRRRS